MVGIGTSLIWMLDEEAGFLVAIANWRCVDSGRQLGVKIRVNDWLGEFQFVFRESQLPSWTFGVKKSVD